MISTVANVATQPATATSATALTEAERTRLSRKDLQQRALELERVNGKNLLAWHNIALQVERSQVQSDRAGAMMATTQQQTKAAERAQSAPSKATSAAAAAAVASSRSTASASQASLVSAVAKPPVVPVQQPVKVEQLAPTPVKAESAAEAGMDIDFPSDADTADGSDLLEQLL